MEPEFIEECQRLRAACKESEESARQLMQHSEFEGEQEYGNQHGEMKANVMLAVRHLEDARMRLGKAIQAKDGGKSVYPK